MASAAIDACCLIDLLVSGEAEAVLRASKLDWRLPLAVQGEVQFRRERDPKDPALSVSMPVDLSPMIDTGLLSLCSPQTQQELDRFTHYATTFRSDGEAMCLALAAERNWIVATDDRKAIRIAKQAGLTVMSCPELVKAWADTSMADHATIRRVLADIEHLAQFKPYPSLPEYQWWCDVMTQ
jgi:hypothetical protein